ncbi:PREDICTED: LETM1 domain-containing protein 1 isoform X2 [Ceratosolen solmsi marchali]|uniref:LETM1 domain-containing protein 1 isoform X2 n=1 Tax=Ceratosolen solmsi marchali TaxID=326594 RepID=A0AAJ7DU20_9HYME|nr:PREDICTED: LETM1 domain-containing protein 1 isoform X2 [Ceratosolen solmsi marchali]
MNVFFFTISNVALFTVRLTTQLQRTHRELLKIHGMSIFRLKNRYRLFQRGLLIHHWDIAIKREGGVTKLSENTIQWALLFRGINPVNMSINNMQMWLNEWIKISSQISKENISLLLHCPILLFYNYQKN